MVIWDCLTFFIQLNSQQNEQHKQLVFLLVMRVAGGLLIESEELSEFAQREVTLHIHLLIHHTAAQSFLMGLPLQDLLLNRPRLLPHKHTGKTWKLCRSDVCSTLLLLNFV